MLKLKFQYFHHLTWRAVSLEKPLKLGKTEGRRRRGWHRVRWLDGSPTLWAWVWVNSGSLWWTGRPGALQSMGCKESDMTEQLNWPELMTHRKKETHWGHWDQASHDNTPCLAFSPQLKTKVMGISEPATLLKAKLLLLSTHITGAENARWAERYMLAVLWKCINREGMNLLLLWNYYFLKKSSLPNFFKETVSLGHLNSLESTPFFRSSL